jgi:broad specificity phosphatase PhoE
MYLLLIRHGETAWNSEGRMQGRTDTPLNSQGIEQAYRLAERLAHEERIDVLYSSPLMRARVTAEIVGRPFGLDPILDIRLVERSAGGLEGLTLAEIEQTFPDLYRTWQDSKERLILPGAEDERGLHQRVSSFLDMIRAKHPKDRVAVVTHGGTLTMFFATLMGLDIEKRFPFRFDNTSVSKVDLVGNQVRIEMLNDTSHLRTVEPGTSPLECGGQLGEPGVLPDQRGMPLTLLPLTKQQAQ